MGNKLAEYGSPLRLFPFLVIDDPVHALGNLQKNIRKTVLNFECTENFHEMV
jgi:hypothetical protein